LGRGGPARSGPAAPAPRVRRGKEIRSAVILRVFAVERFLRTLVFLGLAYGLWRFQYARQSIETAFHRERPLVRELFLQLGYNIDHSKLVGLVSHALTLSTRSIILLAIGLAAYGVIEAVEGTGLWLARRWGEYFAMVATSVGLPLEIYDLARKVTATTLVFFAINLALVVYLVLAKRLFGVRGGFRAYESRLRSESIMAAAVAAAAAVTPGSSPAGPAQESLPAAPEPRAGAAEPPRSGAAPRVPGPQAPRSDPAPPPLAPGPAPRDRTAAGESGPATARRRGTR
jgi:uncharacterized membrane protein (DUF2068 family)